MADNFKGVSPVQVLNIADQLGDPNTSGIKRIVSGKKKLMALSKEYQRSEPHSPSAYRLRCICNTLDSTVKVRLGKPCGPYSAYLNYLSGRRVNRTRLGLELSRGNAPFYVLKQALDKGKVDSGVLSIRGAALSLNPDFKEIRDCVFDGLSAYEKREAITESIRDIDNQTNVDQADDNVKFFDRRATDGKLKPKLFRHAVNRSIDKNTSAETILKLMALPNFSQHSQVKKAFERHVVNALKEGNAEFFGVLEQALEEANDNDNLHMSAHLRSMISKPRSQLLSLATSSGQLDTLQRLLRSSPSPRAINT